MMADAPPSLPLLTSVPLDQGAFTDSRPEASQTDLRVRCADRMGMRAQRRRAPGMRGVGQMRQREGDGAESADVPDRELVEACLAGDDQAWASLVARYGRLIDAVIRRYRLGDDDHADVFQDVCVAIWRDLPKIRDRERLGPWLVTLAGRHSWDARRRLRPRLSEQEI